MSLHGQLCKYLTSTTSPSKERLHNAIIIHILMIMLGIILGFFINTWLTETFLNEADVFVSFSSLDKDELDYFIPVNLINSGQKELTNVKLRLRTCNMQKYDELKFDRLVKTHIELVKFRDIETSELVTKKTCNPDLKLSLTNCEIDAYILNESNVYVPPQTCSIYFCDFCDLEAVVSSDQLSEETFSGKIFIPREHTLSIKPLNGLSVNISPLEKLDTFGINIISKAELCLRAGTCPLTDLNETLIPPYDFSIPTIEMILRPKDYKPFKISVESITFL